MFIVSLTYKCSLEEVGKHLEAHIEYLKEQYSKGNFVASGKKVPNEAGGMIFSQMSSKEGLNAVLMKDPFYIAEVADYEIIEFFPTMTAEGFENIK